MYFEEYTSMTKWQKVCFAVGILTTMAGIVVLLKGNAGRMRMLAKGPVEYTELTQMSDWTFDDDEEGVDGEGGVELAAMGEHGNGLPDTFRQRRHTGSGSGESIIAGADGDVPPAKENPNIV